MFLQILLNYCQCFSRKLFLQQKSFSYVPAVICTNTKLDTSCNLLSDWATTTGRLLGPVMEIFFSKNTKINFLVNFLLGKKLTEKYIFVLLGVSFPSGKFLSQEHKNTFFSLGIESRQPCNCKLALLFTELHRRRLK